MLSGVMMLRHLGEAEAADRLEAAIAEVVREGRAVTYDLKAARDDPAARRNAEMSPDAVIARRRGLTADCLDDDLSAQDARIRFSS